MRWNALEALSIPVWIPVPPDAFLEVEVVPAAAMVTAPLLYSPLSETLCRAVCEYAFTNFRGLRDESGAAVPNSMDARMKLYAWPPCRRAINAKLSEMTEAAAEGEAGAASD